MSKGRELYRYIAKSAAVGALYAALTIALPYLSYGVIQFRVSEALTVLPFFMPEAVPGLFVGCAIANIFSPNPLDVVVGSLATLASAFLTSRIRNKYIAPLPPVLINAAVLGAFFALVNSSGEAFLPTFGMNVLTIGAGQAGACYALGLPLIFLLERTLFRRRDKGIPEERNEK